MLAMGTKYRAASELYAALKMTAPGGGRQMPAFAQLPDWSGLWMASGGGNFFSPGPGGVAPKLTTAAQAALKQGADNQAKGDRRIGTKLRRRIPPNRYGLYESSHGVLSWSEPQAPANTWSPRVGLIASPWPSRPGGP